MYWSFLYLWVLLSGFGTEQGFIIARFDGGVVREADLLREIANLAPNEIKRLDRRQVPESARWKMWSERIALRKIGVLEAQRLGLDRQRLDARAHKRRQSWLVGMWQNDYCIQADQLPSEKELIAKIGDFGPQPPKRINLSHIFLRASTREELIEAHAKLNLWRQEIDSAKEFADYAVRYSQSQSRHINGLLSWVKEGLIPSEIEARLYPLSPGSISEVIDWQNGAHIFYVHHVERSGDVAAQRRKKRQIKLKMTEAKQELKKQCRNQALATAKSALRAVRSGDSTWPDLRIGDHFIRGDLLKAYHQDSERSPNDVIQDYIDNEILFQTITQSDWFENEHRRRLTDLGDAAMYTAVRVKEVSQRIQHPTVEQLRQLYDQEPNLSTRRHQLKIRYLRAEITPKVEPVEFYDRLNGIAAELRTGKLTWQQAKDLEELEFVELPHLDVVAAMNALPPVVSNAIGREAVGTISEAIQFGREIYIVELAGKIPQSRIPFEEVRAKIHKIFMDRQAKRIGVQTGNRLLEEYRFKSFWFGLEKVADVLGK